MPVRKQELRGNLRVHLMYIETAMVLGPSFYANSFRFDEIRHTESHPVQRPQTDDDRSNITCGGCCVTVYYSQAEIAGLVTFIKNMLP